MFVYYIRYCGNWKAYDFGFIVETEYFETEYFECNDSVWAIPGTLDPTED